MSNAAVEFIKDVVSFGPVRRNKVATLLAYLWLFLMHVVLSDDDESTDVLITQTIVFFFEMYVAIFICQGIGQVVLYLIHADRIAKFFYNVVADKKVMSRLVRNTTIVTVIYAGWVAIFDPNSYWRGGEDHIYDPILTFILGWGWFFAVLYIIELVIYLARKLLNKFRNTDNKTDDKK